MSRFFYDYVDGTYTEDHEGEEHPDHAAALDSAYRIASDLARNRPLAAGKIVLKNARGEVLAEVPVSPTATIAH